MPREDFSLMFAIPEDDEIIAIDPSQQLMDAPGTTSLLTQREGSMAIISSSSGIANIADGAADCEAVGEVSMSDDARWVDV